MPSSDRATGTSVLSPFLITIRQRVDAAVDKIVSGTSWQMKALVSIMAISLFHAFPDPRWQKMGSVETLWRATLLKVDHPLTDMGRLFPALSHEAKLTFRLTVPVFAHLLHLGRTGLVVVFALADVLILNSVLSITYETTGSKRAAFYLSLATACIWAGVSGIHERRGGMYDSVALCLLLLTLNSASPILTGIYAFAAAWTDERALITLPMIVVFSMVTPISRLKVRRILIGRVAAIVVAAVAYGASREYLTVSRSLIVATEGVGIKVMAAFANSDPLAIYTALGGSWLIVVMALLVLIAQKRYRMTAAFCVALGVIIATALSVADRTRSLAFCLPAVLAGVSILGEYEPVVNVEGIAICCCLISLVIPLYYVQLDYSWVSFPMPFYVRLLAHSFTGS